MLKNVPDAALFAHLFGGEIAMGSGTVPVAFDWFGVERHVDTEIFSHTVEDVTSYPQVVTHRDTQAWSNLEFPLQIRKPLLPLKAKNSLISIIRLFKRDLLMIY